MGRQHKWHLLMELQVHDVGDGVGRFLANNLHWSPIVVEVDGHTDHCATILLHRLDYFLIGEAFVESAEATFIRTHHNEKHNGTLKEHSTMMYSCYWCAYGPDDHRNDPPTKERARNFTKKWGCQCHIIVEVMKGRPDVAILIFNQRLHVDANGQFCNGVDDTMNEPHSRFAPNLSTKCRSYVEILLLMECAHETRAKTFRLGWRSCNDKESRLDLIGGSTLF
ncbi:hypothetical protein SUGI_0047410 [Cryptomeria japonica]|nr:hypothetical protein SUGI_0047410 [Cryptomeria japonica]